jgi:hypothetical protein
LDEDGNEAPGSEASRNRRRDRRAEAESRAGMRTGLAKLFRQVLDTQSSRAREGKAGPAGDRGAGSAEPGAEAVRHAAPDAGPGPRRRRTSRR